MFNQKGFMRYNISVLIAILFLFVLLACPKMQAINDMSSKEKAVWMLGVYNSQYSDYMITTGHNIDLNGNWVKTKEVNLSEDQKQVLREKKKVLSELYPLIMIYDGYVEKGLVPDREMEQKIIDLINRIQ